MAGKKQKQISVHGDNTTVISDIDNTNVVNSPGYTNSEIRGFVKLESVVVDPRPEGANTGNWIDNFSIMRFLNALEPEGRLEHMTFNVVHARFLPDMPDHNDGIPDVVGRPDLRTGRTYDEDQDDDEGEGEGEGRGHDLVVVVYDRMRKHFFPVMVDFGVRATDTPKVYVYDTLRSSWTPRSVKTFVNRLFPNWKGRKIIYDRTKDIVQTDASCGPWAMWLIMAFVSNIHNWRMNGRNPVFHTRHALTAYDLFGNRVSSRDNQLHLRFWAALQGRLYSDEESQVQSLPVWFDNTKTETSTLS